MAEVVQKGTEADGAEHRLQQTSQEMEVSSHSKSSMKHSPSPNSNTLNEDSSNSAKGDCATLCSLTKAESCKNSSIADTGTHEIAVESESCTRLEANVSDHINRVESCSTSKESSNSVILPSSTCEDSSILSSSAGDSVSKKCSNSSKNALNEIAQKPLNKKIDDGKSLNISTEENAHNTCSGKDKAKEKNGNERLENSVTYPEDKSESCTNSNDTDVKMEDVSDETVHSACPEKSDGDKRIAVHKQNINNSSEINPETEDVQIKNGEIGSTKHKTSDIKEEMDVDNSPLGESSIDDSMDVEPVINEQKNASPNKPDLKSCSVIKVNKELTSSEESMCHSVLPEENKCDSNIDMNVLVEKQEKNKSSDDKDAKSTENKDDSHSADKDRKSDSFTPDTASDKVKDDKESDKKDSKESDKKVSKESDKKDSKERTTTNIKSSQDNTGVKRIIHRSQRPGPKSKKIQVESSDESSDEAKGDDTLLANGEKGNGHSSKNENEKKSNENESEMKGYITDTMNELLGLFGYDQVDESTKNKLQLGKVETSSSKDKISSTATKITEGQSTKSQSESSKPETTKKSNRSCAECGVTKGLKFQVLFQGTTRFLCSDACFQVFRNKQKLAPPPSSGTSGGTTTTSSTTSSSTTSFSTTSSTTTTTTCTATAAHTLTASQAEMCAQCKKEIKNGQGYFPPTGENKPLCSEDCMQKYLQIHGPKQVCAQCKSNIQGRTKCLTWETMEFCNEDCLGKYQAYLGSHCTCCQVPVQQSSLGKYCVRFGSDIRQFCSGRCLEEFKKGLKVCSFCQKDLSSGQEGFLAPVGDKGQFKDFCTQQCMERYETMNSTNSSTPQVQQCSFCKKVTSIKVRVKFEDKTYALCSDPCIAGFRYTKKINTSICDTCHKFFDSEAIQPFSLQFEGSSKRFCSKACMNLFVLSHRKIVPCTWCKVKKYNFDMIERVDSNNHVQLFCSLNCLSLFRVSLNATSSRSVRCDHCNQNLPAQYHLTMSDASIRNFCCYQCVIQFQNQFTNVPTLTTATPSVRQSTSSSSSSSSSSTPSSQTNVSKSSVPQSSTPVISSVISLAPTQLKAATPAPLVPTSQPAPKVVVPQKVIPVRQQASQPPPLAVISTKSPSCVSTITTQSISTAQPSTAQSQVIREVIVKPPPPKSLKNKTVLCKPIMQTKGVSCKPHPCHKAVQTDENEGTPVLMPIPVPVYIPTPVHMYTRPVPCPLPFPLPIPVPVFIPTTKSSAAQILKHIREIQEKIPTNPFEAELLMMAEMIADDDKKIKNEGTIANKSDQNVLNQTMSRSEDYLHSQAKTSSEMPEPTIDLEEALPAIITPLSSREQENESGSGEENLISPRELRARHRSRKRASSGSKGRNKAKKKPKLEFPTIEDSDSLIACSLEGENNPEPSLSQTDSPDANMCLKYTFGVNAWKHWVLEKNAQLEKGSQSSRKLKLFKTDLLQLSPDELNYSLCLFVKEVRKPSGDEYAPDSIYYLCLGIQQYLFENGRIDNIFTDSYYEKFTECLNEVLQKQDVIIDTEGCFISRIEEEILWESKQLGAHSPHVLLNTLMHFNTKFFMLKTVDEHMHLSFSHITKHWRKTPLQAKPGSTARNVLLRYLPPVTKDSQRRRRDENLVYEQSENIDNPLRCPVKLYEFYLSKCPESVKTRNDVFYLYPERSCVPDSPVWYSTQPLGRETVCKMLQRIRMVREINEVYQDYNSQTENCN